VSCPEYLCRYGANIGIITGSQCNGTKPDRLGGKIASVGYDSGKGREKAGGRH